MSSRFRWLPLFFVIATLGGCDFVGDVFEAGLWIGVILVVLVAGLVIWAGMKLFR
jgi:hypothetical protein